MNNTPIFLIKNEPLFLVRNLIYFNNIPALFICKNDKNDFFLVLNFEEEGEQFLITKIKKNDISKMLLAYCDIKNTFLHGDLFWCITNENFLNEDIVKEVKKENLDTYKLPNNGIYYKPKTENDILFAENFSRNKWGVV